LNKILEHGSGGIRNSFMRGVKNLILVDIESGNKLQISGMKEDNRFYRFY